MYIQITRNPFARTTLLRTTLGWKHAECKWCGKVDAKFMYGWERDGLRQQPYWEGPFCSIGCYRAYTDQ